MEIAQKSLTLGIGQSRLRSQWSPFTTIQTVNPNIIALANVRKL